MRPHSPLLCLDDDVLITIATVIKSSHGVSELLSFSAINHYLRSICSPTLFRSCKLTKEPRWLGFSALYSPPLSICPYIRHLLIESAELSFLQYLRDMAPHLHVISNITIADFDEGVDPQLMEIFLSFPTLSSLQFINSCWTHLSCLFYFSSIPAARDLTTLTYKSFGRFQSPYPSSKEVFSEEAKNIWCLMNRNHTSLDSLYLPTESFNYREFPTISWPSLRELTLYGIHPPTSESIAPALGLLPQLRILNLTYAHLHGTPPYQVIPPFSTQTPTGRRLLPHLQSFSISHPDAHDQIWTHLPRDLERLILRDCPRHFNYEKTFWNKVDLDYSLPSHTTILAILRRQPARDCLRELEIVYRPDDQDCVGGDEEVLEFIGKNFRELKKLELHRYRMEKCKRDVDVNLFSTYLRPLVHLETLKLHLDLSTVTSFSQSWDWGNLSHECSVQTLSKIAQDIASSLSSIHSIAILHTFKKFAQWIEFNVRRSSKLDVKGKPEENVTFDLRYPVDWLSDIYPNTQPLKAESLGAGIEPLVPF